MVVVIANTVNTLQGIDRCLITDEETKAQNGQATCPRSCIKWQDFNPSPSDADTSVFQSCFSTLSDPSGPQELAHSRYPYYAE